MADWAAPNLPRTAPNQSRNLPPKLPLKLQQQASEVDPAVSFNPRSNYLQHTWAQTFFSRPELYFQPRSVAELTKIVTLARRNRKRICVTGFGHSPSILSLTSSWLVNLDNFSQVLEWDVDDSPGRVRFEAGLSLHGLNAVLADKGYTLPNLGSIDVQSVAGAISTGTHGSSLNHGLLSQNVTAITVLLSNSQLVTCSATKNPEVFQAALLSLGALGVIVELTFQAVPDFNISWSQSLQPLSTIMDSWSVEFWKQREYTRVWWLPYLKRAVVWSAVQTEEPVRRPNATFYGGKLGFYVYHNLLALSNRLPRILPWVEWFVFGMQYGFRPGSFTMTAVQPAREGLLMDCLYSQFVNEWALPLDRGPEAITRLSDWINGDEETSRIPFSSQGLYVHCPIEVRVTDTVSRKLDTSLRPYLDPTHGQGPTLYLNATLYRPYGRDPPCHQRYYEAFEWLMKELGGRPHWAKNFAYTSGREIESMYGEDMKNFMKVRDEVDPDGMFIGQWHCQNLPVSGATRFAEEEVGQRRMGRGWGDGVFWEGESKSQRSVFDDEDDDQLAGSETPTTTSMTSRTSEESFDLMAKGEASVYASMD